MIRQLAQIRGSKVAHNHKLSDFFQKGFDKSDICGIME